MPYLFRSYAHPKTRADDLYEKNPGEDNWQQIWQIARATSAAPFSFDSIEFEQDGTRYEWLDGGLGCCNPSEEAYRSVKQLFNNGSHVVELVMSIGTGETKSSKRKKWLGYGKFLKHGSTIIDLATQCESTHTNMQAALKADGVPYCRLNIKEGLGTIALDCWKGKNGDRTLKKMNDAADAYLNNKDVKIQIDDFARKLVKIRRARARFKDRHPDRWERFCHGVSYVCENGNCGRKGFLSRNGFKSHLQEDHKELFKNESQLDKILDQGKQYLLFQEDAGTNT